MKKTLFTAILLAASLMAASTVQAAPQEVTMWHYFDQKPEQEMLADMVEEYNSLQDDIHINATFVSRTELACLIFQFTIGFAFAMFFNQKFKLAGPIRGLILVSYMMPMAVTGLLGKNIFSNAGLINDLLGKIGISGPEWLVNTSTALIAVIIMNCWVGIPFNMLLLVSGLTSISPDVYESASMDGANWGQRFLFITLPLMKESILAVLMLGFIYTFRAFDLMYIMTAGGPLNSTDVLGTYSYMLSFTQFNFSKGAAVAMVLFACLFLIGLFYLKLLSKEEEEG